MRKECEHLHRESLFQDTSCRRANASVNPCRHCTVVLGDACVRTGSRAEARLFGRQHRDPLKVSHLRTANVTGVEQAGCTSCSRGMWDCSRGLWTRARRCRRSSSPAPAACACRDHRPRRDPAVRIAPAGPPISLASARFVGGPCGREARRAAGVMPATFYDFGRLMGGTTPLARYAVTSLP